MHKKILIIDDDREIRETLDSVFQMEGYTVSTAENGSDALTVLDNATEKPDLIFLDLMMPVMDGKEFLKQIKANPEYQSIPVAVITAAGLQHRPAQADEFLLKPIDLSHLLAVTQKWCKSA